MASKYLFPASMKEEETSLPSKVGFEKDCPFFHDSDLSLPKRCPKSSCWEKRERNQELCSRQKIVCSLVQLLSYLEGVEIVKHFFHGFRFFSSSSTFPPRFLPLLRLILQNRGRRHKIQTLFHFVAQYLRSFPVVFATNGSAPKFSFFARFSFVSAAITGVCLNSNFLTFTKSSKVKWGSYRDVVTYYPNLAHRGVTPQTVENWYWKVRNVTYMSHSAHTT